MKNNLKLLRIQKGIAQHEMEKLMEVSHTTYWVWESGRGFPSIPNLLKLTAILGCTVEEIYQKGEEI